MKDIIIKMPKIKFIKLSTIGMLIYHSLISFGPREISNYYISIDEDIQIRKKLYEP